MYSSISFFVQNLKKLAHLRKRRVAKLESNANNVVMIVRLQYPIIGIACAMVAIIIAWFKYPVMLSVLAAIGVDYLIYLFII